VPTQLHEVIVEMFRTRPELARELLVTCARFDVANGVCESASIDLSQAMPSEYRADAVTVIRDRGDALGAIIVEVQLSTDADKAHTWPVYVTTLRARLRCPVTLLVIAPDAVAGWARRPIELGHPGFVLEPVVIAFSELPRITRPDEALRAPELAVLSVLAHRDFESALAAVAAIDTMPSEAGKLYLDLVLREFSRATQLILEAFVRTKYKYQSDFAVRHRVEGIQDAVVKLVCSKVGDLPAFLQDRIYATDEDRLLELIVRLGPATAEEALHILEHELPPVYGDVP